MGKYLDLVGISSSLKWENFEYSVVGSGKYFSRSKFYDAVITENLWDSRTCANNFCIRFRHDCYRSLDDLLYNSSGVCRHSYLDLLLKSLEPRDTRLFTSQIFKLKLFRALT